MTCLGPELPDRAADMARADNADFHLGPGRRLTQCRRRLKRRLEDEHSRNAQQRAASAIDSDMLDHRHTNCELRDEILSRPSGLESFISSRALS